MPTKRTPKEVGAIIQDRRIRLKLTQDEIDGVSSSTVRKLENGTAASFARSTLVAIAEWLIWPDDFYSQLIAGVAPADLDAQVRAAVAAPRGKPATGLDQDAVDLILAGMANVSEPALAALRDVAERLDRIEEHLGVDSPERQTPRRRPSAGQ